MFSRLGPTEIIVIVVLLIVVFGWKKLPDAARSLGRSARVFKSEVDEMKKESAAASETVKSETIESADQAKDAVKDATVDPEATRRPDTTA